VFNADLVGAFNILITPSPVWGRGNGLETRPGIEPSGRGDVTSNLLVLGEPPHFRVGRRSDLVSY
jgi:transposase